MQVTWISYKEKTKYVLISLFVLTDYSVEREHGGLRQIAGYGVTVTRGAASGMMFTYSCLLVTMCRNILTVLRETFLHRYIPFDSAITFHKYIAFLALFFTGQ
jgi:dual oxidase